MKKINHFSNLTQRFFVAALFLANAGSALADVHYVDVTSTNSMSPYTNWATAAVTIQAAVDAAVAGDPIVVTNGLYAGGVSVNKTLAVRSVNGSQFTTIDGSGSQWGAILAAGASLSGFTLVNSTAGATGGILNNCVSSGHSGYGASSCTLNNCTVSSNSAASVRLHA